MDYFWIKALHVVAVVTWISGMMTAGVVVAAAAAGGASLPSGFVEALRRWDRRVTSPAMLAVWALGLYLASSGGWFAHGWLQAKMAIVLLLSAIHGMISGRLRRLAGGTQPRAGIVARAPLVVLLATGAIVILVILKPF